jgi:hypothetical protein
MLSAAERLALKLRWKILRLFCGFAQDDHAGAVRAMRGGASQSC